MQYIITTYDDAITAAWLATHHDDEFDILGFADWIHEQYTRVDEDHIPAMMHEYTNSDITLELE